MMNDYYDIKALSASQIKQYAKNPYLFWKYSVFNPNALTLDTSATIFGSLCHCLLLEADTFEDNYVISPYETFRTKEAQEWKQQQTLTVISKKDFEQAKKMINAIHNHPLASSLVTGLNTEKPFIQDIPNTEYKLKGKVDGIKRLANGQIIVIDYKTTNSLENWDKWAYKDYHDIQVAVYDMLVKERYGKYPDRFIFLCQSTKEDFEDMISFYEFNEPSRERAREYTQDLIKEIVDKLKNNDKFEYSNKINLISNRYRDIYDNKLNEEE